MSNATAVAPARATTSQKPAKAAPTRHDPEPTPQWLELGLQHTRRLCDLVYTLVDAETKAEGLIQELVEAAESQLYGLVAEEARINVAADGVLGWQISNVALMLEAAWYAAEHGPLDYPPELYVAVLPSAITYAKGLVHALQEAPLTDRFQALAHPRIVAGTRPHRERPRPPIRRIEEKAGEQPEDLMLHAIMLGDLVQWIVGARDTLEALGWAVSNSSQLKEELRRHEVPYGYPEWGMGKVGEGVQFLLNEQHLTIKALGAKAGAA